MYVGKTIQFAGIRLVCVYSMVTYLCTICIQIFVTCEFHIFHK